MDRHGYADEDKRIMAAVARHVLSLVEGAGTSNVVTRHALAASPFRDRAKAVRWRSDRRCPQPRIAFR